MTDLFSDTHAAALDANDPLPTLRGEFHIPRHGDSEQAPGAGIAALGLDDADQARLYHGTALEWLGLQASRFQ